MSTDNFLSVTDLARKNVRELTPYLSARRLGGNGDVWLNANEYPTAVEFQLSQQTLNRYPECQPKAVIENYAQYAGVKPEQVLVSRGADEGIELLVRAFCEPGKDAILYCPPTYGMYKVAAAINDVPMREVPLEPDFSLDERKLLAATDGDTRLLLLCSPNNPTGNCFPRAQIERIVRTFPGIVVLDEAYIDFADTPGLLGELDRFPNLIILQTLSKAWGMAGLRLGLAFAQEEIVETLSRVKYPYNINVITQRAVLERLETSIDGQVAEIVSERERVAEALRTLPAVRKIYPSQANFLLARFDDPRGVYERLIGEGIIVRDRSRVAGCEGCLRITIGTPAQNDRLIETLKNETA